MVNDKRMTLQGSLLLVSADNLAAHYLGGFKSLSAAFRKCRYCLATEADINTKVLSLSK